MQEVIKAVVGAPFSCKINRGRTRRYVRSEQVTKMLTEDKTLLKVTTECRRYLQADVHQHDKPSGDARW